MTTTRTEKELAFLHDLFIAPDWGERFAELIDEHVVIPNEGKVLYIGVGTGGHAIALHERSSKGIEFLCLDENPECLELARAKATATSDLARFRQATLDNLDLADNHFDVVIGNASLVPQDRIAKMFSEMVRVAAPGAQVALTLPSASSFGEFFSIYWEAMHNSGLIDHESDVEHLITELPAVTQIEKMAEEEGLSEIESWTRIEEFDFDTGEQFLNSPLVSEFLMQEWLATVPDEARNNLVEELSRLINEERHEAEFALSVKATLVLGRKTHTH
ncbi:MAG TPA: class I SAM-dependent methyltransferase [Pyrinomonadaceae bacterium]|jgi:ubiquinone/menaquinone biosynthesis C-methylase UbiE